MIELNGIQLDKTSAVPLYEQLRKALLEAITSGKLSAGTKLPTEEELCAQFGISRPVARQAYNMLIESLKAEIQEKQEILSHLTQDKVKQKFIENWNPTTRSVNIYDM